jgi:hypothetical protein
MKMVIKYWMNVSISNQDGFKINRKKINAINKELWGDDKIHPL